MKIISYISGFMIPFLLFYVIGWGLLTKRDIYHDFLEGAKEGLNTVRGLVPVLVGLMTAVGVLRASGFLDFLGKILGKITTAAGIPPQIVPLGPTESVFYCMSVYFGSVGIQKTRYTLAGALIATLAGMAASVWIVTCLM